MSICNRTLCTNTHILYIIVINLNYGRLSEKQVIYVAASNIFGIYY